MFFEGISPKSEKCCGCGGCSQICPQSAIIMDRDKEGFIMPRVNPQSCVECGACERVCPIINSDKVISEVTGVCYGAINKDYAELMNSSSGGIFSVIANHILDKGGLVYGAAFDDKMQLTHICVDEKENLYKLRGSKYLQSDIKNVFKRIHDDLRNGKWVYFTGTGCQVAGLRCFLKKDYDNLICSDILCHGTPNQQVFDYVIKTLENNYRGKVVNYLFRDKKINGWSCSSSCVIERKSKIKYIGFDSLMEAYFKAFIKGIMNREVCYECPFAKSFRSGDITLADYWGAEKYIPQKNFRAGISAIIINTKKGENLLSKINSKLVIYPANINDIAVINQTLVAPTPRPELRNSFFEKFREDPQGFLLSFNGNLRKARLVYHIKKVIKTNPVLLKLLRLIRK